MKKNKFIFFSIIILFLFSAVGCNRIEFCCEDINTGIDLRYKDNKDSLLISRASDIKLYYEINGKKVKPEEVISKNRTEGKGYLLIGDSIFISIFVNDIDIKDALSTTYLQVDDYSMDTIVCKHKKEENSRFLEKVWINKKLVLEDSRKLHMITVIK